MSADTTTTGRALADLLAVAVPGRFRDGVPDPDAVPLARFAEPGPVAGFVDEMCGLLATNERTAAGFGLYYSVAHALVGPLLAAMLSSDGEPFAPDLERTMVGRGSDGLIDRVWPCAGPSMLGRDPGVVASWLGHEFARVRAAFLPQLRIGPRSYAAATGAVLAHQAERMGRLVGEVRPAREVVAELSVALYPLVRAAQYREVAVGPGLSTVPVGTVCCQWYRLTQGFCAGCPRKPEPLRSQHLREYVARVVQPARDDVLTDDIAPGTGHLRGGPSSAGPR